MTNRLCALATALPLPNRAGWRQAIRMTLAALLAYLGTELVGLQQGYWAVITCLIIVQGSLGATISAGIARVAGTAAGAVMGGVGVLLLRLHLGLPEWVILLIVIIPLALLVASRPIFRLAPLTGALVLLLAGSSDLAFAFSRIAEIALGCGIGVLVSLFVLPERATSVLLGHAAAILDELGAFAAILLGSAEPVTRERGAAKLRAAFAQIQNDMKEVDNERAARLLRSDPFPERLVRHLQRLRTDVNMLGRAVAPRSGGENLAGLADLLKRQFEASAAVLRTHAISETHEPLDELMKAAEAETPLGFALATLQNELAELRQALKDWTMPAKPPHS